MFIFNPIEIKESKCTDWRETDYEGSSTTATALKSAESGKKFYAMWVSGGGNKDGWLIVRVGLTEVFRQRFAKDTTIGQTFKGSPIKAGDNVNISAKVILDTSGACAVNMGGGEV